MHRVVKSCIGLKSIAILLFLIAQCSSANANKIPSSERSRAAIERVSAKIEIELAEKNLELGSAVFIRIFKNTKKLEVWLQSEEQTFKLFKRYSICTYSGRLGPKTKQGDWQAPEGFYYVPPANLNPWSRYHLSFNLGYPNKYDRYHGRTGSALMVHGKCVSIGCYAMTNKYIEEIYALMDAAYRSGQPFVRVHIFPFKMTEERLQERRISKWFSFWQNLKEGYDYFEAQRKPPNVELKAGKYVFE
ncbi:Murein L,D-transpeptidase YafK [Alteromonadaceae bacterium Bs31]|nr:Murein L,D-transpeptidase YafK [Alteromonadaceae bacterium Bs31]